MSSYPTRNREFQKNSKKIQKIKKYHYCFISSQNKLVKAKKEGKKIKKIVPMSFYLTRNRELKKIAKKFKKLKNTIMATFLVKINEERPRKRENKK